MNIVYAILLFFLGATCFSFYYVVALRLPKKQTLQGRSYCDHCLKPLRFVDVLPVIGYFINKGRCSSCTQSIQIKYVISEIVGGLLFSISYLFLGFSADVVVFLTTISVFFILSISDIYYTLVIDRVWMVGLVVLVVVRWFQSTFFDYLLSAVFMFLILYLIAFVGKMAMKKVALGGGDVKVYLFIGFVLPFPSALLSLFLAALSGLLYGLIKKGKNGNEIPLIPFIAFGVVIALLYGNIIIEFYLRLLGVSNG
jgi:leader peptidase (prepilin peptidase)/N-methyltransferase